VIDEGVRTEIFALESLAPLHNGPALRAIEEAERALPDVPQVAVFDSGFHATIPDEAAVYALPRQWREAWGVHRYGFHGLSVQWSAEQVSVPRLVVCHLGGGCSVTAVRDGRSVETSMGFTPLEGVPMATRSGSVDPGAVLYLARQRGLDVVGEVLERESGLLGVSGLSGDVRSLEADERGSFALELLCYRVAQAAAACAVALGGLDAIAFSGGIGEHSERVRQGVVERSSFLQPFRVEVVHAREDLVAARAARHVLGIR
jgi:acetate kinase